MPKLRDRQSVGVIRRNVKRSIERLESVGAGCTVIAGEGPFKEFDVLAEWRDQRVAVRVFRVGDSERKLKTWVKDYSWLGKGWSLEIWAWPRYAHKPTMWTAEIGESQ